MTTIKDDNNESEHIDCDTLQRQLEQYAFIRLVTTDINGIHITKLVPARNAYKIARNKADMYAGLIAFGPRNEVIDIPELRNMNFGNGLLTVFPNTLRPLPWATIIGGGNAEQRICEIIFESNWPNGEPVEAHPRRVLRRQIEILREKHRCIVMAAFEPEYRAFHNHNRDATKKYVPLNNCADMYRTCSLLQFEKFFCEADTQLFEADIKINDYTIENGMAQLESPLEPSYGVMAADRAFSFKQAIKEIALNHDFVISHMTSPLSDISSSGIHFNHSIWSLDKKRNIMYDEKDENNLSEFMIHWIGGILTHIRALVALSCPTVNCYRRLKKGLAPHVGNWDIDQRFSSLRVKNRGEDGTYAEFRIPSSASCAYIVMAAVLAAGMDGLSRKLTPPKRGDKENVTQLPTTLTEALLALEEDKVLCENLGEQFCRWFIKIKRDGELTVLKDVDLNDYTTSGLAKEREEYFQFI